MQLQVPNAGLWWVLTANLLRLLRLRPQLLSQLPDRQSRALTGCRCLRQTLQVRSCCGLVQVAYLDTWRWGGTWEPSVRLQFLG